MTTVEPSAGLIGFTPSDQLLLCTTSWQKPPKNKNIQYAVLSDEGEFIRSVPGRKQQIPISHWRPWYLPKEPHEFDGDPDLMRDREPIVTVDEEPSPD